LIFSPSSCCESAVAEPKISVPHLALHRPDLRDLDNLDAEIRLELFNAMLGSVLIWLGGLPYVARL